jgi:hypothetical protein
MLVTLSEFQEKDEVKEEGKRILKKHVSNPNRKQKKTKHNDYFLKAQWENIIMANYEIDPEILLPLAIENLIYIKGKHT